MGDILHNDIFQDKEYSSVYHEFVVKLSSGWVTKSLHKEKRIAAQSSKAIFTMLSWFQLSQYFSGEMVMG